MSDVFGKNLGQYILLEQLGEGGMAKVYNAFDTRVGQNVAIKVILPSKRNSQVFLQQFEVEAKTLASLTHTNIVKVLNYGTQDGQPFLVMEFISGGTLKETMQRPIPWDKAASILSPIARALDYVHKQNKVHRDVKPSNILIDENYQPMLSDFGVVKLLETKDLIDSDAIGVGVGTPEYMSPEQTMGKEVDFRADIYSLGLVFFELVTGRKPFIADTPMAVAIKHVTDELPLPTKLNPAIPDFVECVIMRAVNKNPEKRFHDMREFADALELLSQGNKKNRKEILKISNYHKVNKKALPLSLFFMLFLISGLYILFSYFNIFDTYSIPIKSVYELGIFYNEQKMVPPQPTIFTTLIYKENVILVTATPSPTKEETALSNAQVNAKSSSSSEVKYRASNNNIVLEGTVIPNLDSTIGVEVARWGIGAVNAIDWSNDGDLIGVGASSGVFLYDAISKDLQTFINTDTLVKDMAINNLNNSVITGSENGQVSEWENLTGKFIRDFKYVRPDSERIGNQNSPVNSIDLSENTKKLAIGFDNGAINIYDLISGNLILTEDQYPTTKDLKISKDGRFLYISNGENKIFVWEISTKNLIGNIELKSDCTRMALSNSGQFLLCGSKSQQAIMVDLFEERVVYSFSNLGFPVTEVSFSKDDNLVLIGLGNGEIEIFSRPTTTEYFSVVTPLIKINGHPDQVRSISYSPTKDVFISSSWLEGLLEWDALTGEKLFSLNRSMPAVSSMHFSNNGTWLISSHLKDKVFVWQVANGKKLYSFNGYLPDGNPISADNKYFAIIVPPQKNGEQYKIQVINLENGRIERSLSGYEPGWFVGFTKKSDILVAGNVYKAILWDVATWERLNTHGGPTEGCGQFFTPQNERLMMISRDQIIYDYSQSIVENMCNRPADSNAIKSDEEIYADTIIKRRLYESIIYQFIGTGNRNQKWVALGSQFGSIHLFKMP